MSTFPAAPTAGPGSISPTMAMEMTAPTGGVVVGGGSGSNVTSSTCSPTNSVSISQSHQNQIATANGHVTAEGLMRLKQLYPYVDEEELPKCWSAKDKANFISLSENNLKVHYKGTGKNHKDAASVRATHPVPPACLLYYYEIKIISKGRDGYMGIGLAAANVNMQRLPGWDKQSYGYHGDDGHSFCSSGTGQPYGPTFTTGDVIGCAYNLVEGTCFYTKNGLSLGIAFTDLPNVPLYPVVGLQTPGEEVEANFGMEPFRYNIMEDIIALRQRITGSIMSFPVNYNEWQTTLHKLIQSWLIHNGYCSTAELFSEATKQEFKGNVHKIRQRHRIQQLILSGKIGDAISLTNKLYPTVLRDNPNLLFALKCRQFIEYIAGNDNVTSSTSSKTIQNGSCADGEVNGADCNGNAAGDQMDVDGTTDSDRSIIDGHDEPITNGTSGTEALNHEEGDQTTQLHEGKAASFLSNERRLQTLLEFGKELHAFSQQLKRQYGTNETNKKMLQDAFSLIAYSDPRCSPVGWQLNSQERETVCQALNNAIVMSESSSSSQSGGSSAGAFKPPLELIVKQTKALVKLNGQCGAWLLDKL